MQENNMSPIIFKTTILEIVSLNAGRFLKLNRIRTRKNNIGPSRQELKIPTMPLIFSSQAGTSKKGKSEIKIKTGDSKQNR